MKVRKIWAVVLSIAMTVILIGAVKFSDTTVVADTFGIITPTENSLVGAGHFDIKWSNATKGTVVSYKLYIDNQLVTTTTQTSYEYYTTTVKMYSAYVTAEYSDGSSQNTTTVNFGVTKKGLCANENMAKNLNPVQMNVGWYYNWSANPHSYDNFDKVEYVPMIWGTGYEGSISTVANAGYKHLLAYNEPDMGGDVGGSNIDVNTAISHWSNFLGNSYYLGSPAPALCPAWDNGTWFRTFMDGIDQSTVDFIALHCYYYQYAGVEEAEQFLREVVDKTYEMYKKPIWITEFAISGWSYDDTENIEVIKEFMKTAIDGLNSRSYVERYAWFSFGADDANNGASALYDVDTGVLTDLGELYVGYGNPEGYVTPEPETENYTITSGSRNTLLDSSINIDGITYKDFVNESGVTATASASNNDSNSADKAIDNDINSRWESPWQDTASITIDLGKFVNIKQINVIWETASAKEYTIEVSADGQNYTRIAKETDGASYDYKNDTILLTDMVSARYIRINGISRNTIYGYSIWDIAVYGEEVREEPTTEEETTTNENTITISDKVKVEGYQISHTNGGLRTVSSVEPEINGQTVVEYGNIYAIVRGDVTAEEMYIGVDNNYVASYKATEAGIIDLNFSDSETAINYVRTMINNGDTNEAFEQKYMIRAYAKLADGSYVYSKVGEYTIFNVAKVLYDNVMMPNLAGHNYIYNNILKVVDNNYIAVDYNWNREMVKP